MTLLKEPDFGTPAREGEATVELTIDGVTVTVPPGTSVMRRPGYPEAVCH
jgi:formate dehydrogenase major subunit